MKSTNFIFEDDEDEFDGADELSGADVINDSGYTLRTGSKLYCPGENYRIAIVELTTTDLRTDGKEFGDWLARGTANKDNPLVIQLNSHDDERYAQVATLYRAVFDSVTRKLSTTDDIERIYVIYTNANEFVWDTNPNDAPQNRLPTRYEYVGLNGEGTGGKYWQPFLSMANSSKKRDGLKPSNLNSIMSRIDATNRQVANQILKDKAVNFFTIQSVIQKSRSINKFSTYPKLKRQYLSELLGKFIDNPDQKPYPMVLVNYGDYIDPNSTASRDRKTVDYKNAMSADLLSQTGLERIQSLTVDFMEIIHPVALVNNNLNGNANKKILEFLGASSYDELKSGASIQFHASGEGARTNTPLIDSTVYYRGRKIEISSKKAGGMGASLKNLADKLQEVLLSSGDEMREILNSNENYSKSYNFLINIFNADRGEQYKVAFNIASPNDASIAEQMKDEMRRTPAREHLTSEILTRYGFSGTIAKIYEENKPRTIPNNSSQWKLLMIAVWTAVTNELNSNPAFGNLVTWIFNHGAVIQVDTQTQEINTKTGRAEVLTNIIGTWPSQAVETVKLSPTMSGENVKYSLLINGYKDQSFSTDDDDTSPLSDRDKQANTKPVRPTGRDTYTSAEDWTSPDEATFTAQNIRGNSETTLPTNTWAWAGSEYSSEEMIEYGVPREAIQKVMTDRLYLIGLVELASSGPLNPPTNNAQTQNQLFENAAGQLVLTPRLVSKLTKGQLDALMNYKRKGRVDDKVIQAFRVAATGNELDDDTSDRVDNRLRAEGFARLLKLKQTNPQAYQKVYRDITQHTATTSATFGGGVIEKQKNDARLAELKTQIDSLRAEQSKIPDTNKGREKKLALKSQIEVLIAEWQLITQVSNPILSGSRVTNELRSAAVRYVATIRKGNPKFDVDERLQPILSESKILSGLMKSRAILSR